MVYISEPEELLAELKVVNVRYDLKEKKAELTLSYRVMVGRGTASRELKLSIPTDKSSVADLEKMITEKRNRLAEALNKMRETITPLLKLSKYVEVDLRQIADQLMMEVESLKTI